MAMAVDGESHLSKAETDIRRPRHCVDAMAHQALDPVARCSHA